MIYALSQVGETCKRTQRLSMMVGLFLSLSLRKRSRVYSSAGVSASPWASCSLFASTFSAGSAGAFLLLALGFFIVTTIDGATRAPPLRLSSSVDKVEGLISPRVARAAISPSFVVGA